jgi:hypothetical protein
MVVNLSAPSTSAIVEPLLGDGPSLMMPGTAAVLGLFARVAACPWVELMRTARSALGPVGARNCTHSP